MATLSKNGREVTRWERERQTPDDESVSWRRTTLSERENGWILRKDDALFRATAYKGAYRHNWGWKRFCKRSRSHPSKWYVSLLNAPEWRCVAGMDHVRTIVATPLADAASESGKAVA